MLSSATIPIRRPSSFRAARDALRYDDRSDGPALSAEPADDLDGHPNDPLPAATPTRRSSYTVTFTPVSERALSTKEIDAFDPTFTSDDSTETAPAGDPEAVPLASDFPDGGRAAYCAAAGAAMVLFSTFALSNSWGSIFAELSKNQLKDYSASSTSWIGSSHLCVVFWMGLPAGRLFDLGYFQAQLAAGSCLWVFGIFMLSLSTEFYQIFLSYSICLGLALGLLFTSSIGCVGAYFYRKRSFFIGCAAAGAALGSVILPILMNHLFPRVGFAGTIRAVGYLQGGMLLIANLIMRPRALPPKPPAPIFPLIRSFLRQPSTWACCLGAAFVMLGMFVPIFYIQVFYEQHQAAPVVVTYSIAILNGAAVLSRLVGGLIADRIGVFNIAIPVSFMTGVLAYAMLGATSTASAIVFAFLYGFASGGWVSMMSPAFMSLASDVSEIGVRAGLGFIFVGCTSLVGAPIAGALLSAAGGPPKGYYAPLVFGGTAMLVGSAFITVCRITQVKRRGGAWRV